MAETYDYIPYEKLTTPGAKANWTRAHRKVRESSKLRRNVSTGDASAGGNALAMVRSYKPSTGPRIVRADKLKPGMIVTPVGTRSRFTVNEVSKGKNRATRVNGQGVPAHRAYRVW